MRAVKVFSLILVLAITFAFGMSFCIQNVYAEDKASVVIGFSIVSQDENRIVIKANLVQNSGICAMKLNLEYDTDIMQLVDFSFGQALNSLNPITTNTNTEQGYAIYPFAINYEGESNDSTKGELALMTFELKDTSIDGSFEIRLTYQKNKDVIFFSNKSQTAVNPIVDKAVLTLQNGSLSQVDVEVNKSNEGNVLLIVLICVGVLALGGAVALVALLKKKKNEKRDKEWIKL